MLKAIGCPRVLCRDVVGFSVNNAVVMQRTTQISSQYVKFEAFKFQFLQTWLVR